MGDAADAVHHAKVARRHLDDMALTRLLSAQAAQLNGDKAAAQEHYTAMLAAPETEFLGLKGLYSQAMASGDNASARDHAEKAFKLRSNARWAFESVIDLGLARGAWGDVRAAIADGRRNNLIPADKADRANAALFTAGAYAASVSEDEKAALQDVEAALKLAPDFAPAAQLAARIHREVGRKGKAAKIIETAFASGPHPALIREYDKVYADEPAERRAVHLQKLAAKNPDSREAVLLEARAHNLLEEWASAMTKLEPLLTNAPTAFEYSLMATAAAGLNGEAAGREWLERAASAPRDPRPGGDGEFHINREGWGRLAREYMEHGRLAPPPLEDLAAGVSSEEIRLLTAPPAPDVLTLPEEEVVVEDSPKAAATPATDEKGEDVSPDQEDDHIHNDEEAERAAAAARKVS